MIDTTLRLVIAAVLSGVFIMVLDFFMRGI